MTTFGNILEITAQSLQQPTTAAEARGQAPIRGFLSAFAGARNFQRQQLEVEQASEARSLNLQLLRARLSNAQQELNPQPLSGLEGIGGGGVGSITSQLIPTTQGVFANTPQGLRRVDNQTLSFLERRQKQERAAQASTIAFSTILGPLIENNLLADEADPEANAAAGRRLLNATEFLSPGEATTLFRTIRADRLAGRTLAEASGRFPEFDVRREETQVGLIEGEIKEAGRQLNRLSVTTFVDANPLMSQMLSFAAPAIAQQPLITITDAQIAQLRIQGQVGDATVDQLDSARRALQREAANQQKLRRAKAREKLIIRPAGQPFRTVQEFDAHLNRNDVRNGVGAMILEAVKERGIPNDLESVIQSAEGMAQCAGWDSVGTGYIEQLASQDPDLQHLVPDADTDGSLVLPNGRVITTDDLKTQAQVLNMTESELRKALMDAGATEPDVAP